MFLVVNLKAKTRASETDWEDLIELEADAVRDLEATGSTGSNNVGDCSNLFAFADRLLDSRDQLLVIFGDPGAGKSTFLWKLAQRCCTAVKVKYDGSSESDSLPWWPVMIDMKLYTQTSLKGLFVQLLKSSYDVSDQQLATWASQDSESRARHSDPALFPRFLLLCDGLDELRDDGSSPLKSLRDFVAILCDGTAWSARSLKVVVTCRESFCTDRGHEEALFGRHQRCVILPLSDGKVRE